MSGFDRGHYCRQESLLQSYHVHGFFPRTGRQVALGTRQEQNLHANGTHGLFNERMREHAGHVCFTGPEAVCYLSPSYPERGVCDTSA